MTQEDPAELLAKLNQAILSSMLYSKIKVLKLTQTSQATSFVVQRNTKTR